MKDHTIFMLVIAGIVIGIYTGLFTVILVHLIRDITKGWKTKQIAPVSVHTRFLRLADSGVRRGHLSRAGNVEEDNRAAKWMRQKEIASHV